MKGKKHTPEPMARKLREADQLLGAGQDLATVARQPQLTDRSPVQQHRRPLGDRHYRPQQRRVTMEG